jgi:hypothetical protein
LYPPLTNPIAIKAHAHLKIGSQHKITILSP